MEDGLNNFFVNWNVDQKKMKDDLKRFFLNGRQPKNGQKG
jgi:hypothetical protein